MRHNYLFTRRRLLTLASAACASPGLRMFAGEAEFWNKKDPSEWSSEEIDKLKTKSPWAKEVTISVRQSNSGGNNYPGNGGNTGGGYPGGGGGYPGGGGIGYPGGGGGYGYPGGGGGMGRRRGGMGGPAPLQYHGVVRWLSAKPIQEAMKAPLPPEMADAYVISVSGIPIVTGNRQQSGDDSSGSSGSNTPSPDTLDRIKGLTYLEPKDKSPEQPSIVQPGSAGFETNVLLFAFSHEGLHLAADSKEVSFTTQLGRVEVKTRFNLKEMLYRKELAV